MKVWQKCFTNNFHIQLFVHDALEDADRCRAMHADSGPHVHFCWMFGPSWKKEKKLDVIDCLLIMGVASDRRQVYNMSTACFYHTYNFYTLPRF